MERNVYKQKKADIRSIKILLVSAFFIPLCFIKNPTT